jgi:hypothetical protein
MMHPNGRGKQRVWFDDGEHFGPSYVNMRTGELSPWNVLVGKEPMADAEKDKE